MIYFIITCIALLYDAGMSTQGMMPSYLSPIEINCNFESPCSWKWDGPPDGFHLVSALQVANSSTEPVVDADNNEAGHFLYLNTTAGSAKQYRARSPTLSNVMSGCRLDVMLHVYNMSQGMLIVVAETQTLNHSWVLAEMNGDTTEVWRKYHYNAYIRQPFSVLLEVVSGPQNGHVAIDNIEFVNCYPVFPEHETCDVFRCKEGRCLQKFQICDMKKDCLEGEDEEQECDKIPPVGRCDFENGWCGWHNESQSNLWWQRHSGETPNDRTGPRFDHTYQNLTGVYAYVNMRWGKLGDVAKLRSTVFNPPPPCIGDESMKTCNQSCKVQFYYHKYGARKDSLALYLYEEHPKSKEKNLLKRLAWLYEHGSKDDKWLWYEQSLPQMSHQYYLQFEAVKGLPGASDIAIDDVSLSRECFGIGIPPEELGSYNYSAYKYDEFKDPNENFVNATHYVLSSCGVNGREGPKPKNCNKAYNNTPQMKVKVLTHEPLEGVQVWTAPDDGHYTFIVKGASGGKGSKHDVGSSYGAVIRGVVELKRGQKIYVMVGQRGLNACKKYVSSVEHSPCVPPKSSTEINDKIREVNEQIRKEGSLSGGGGGGGGTFVFTIDSHGHPEPLIIAGGGGGLADNPVSNKKLQHAHGIRHTSKPMSGTEYGNNSAGSGGGWKRYANSAMKGVSGSSLLKGGKGGAACYYSSNGEGDGGFGGGGGGCSAGGGGGGYVGGNAWNDSQENGEGGYSYISDKVILGEEMDQVHVGNGLVHIIHGVESGCGCDFQCVALDEYRHKVQCICAEKWTIDKNNKTCIQSPPSTAGNDIPNWAYSLAAVGTSCLLFIVGIGGYSLCKYYNSFQKTKMEALRKRISRPDVELNRLREASDNFLTEYNPNYEFGGETYSVRDLKDIPRDHLRLVKALGQGAFGEVYQGFYKHRLGDAVEMPVAVKTLPALSTTEAEKDFLLEALIMNKFNHPNIVHFIGVCFDTHPRFIILELLAGGDLKTFLRESRPRADKQPCITMKDLILCAIDVAKGCQYLEENHFTHRDIAARNCLLTTRGPGKVVKIADFGMARDIYGADYYRKRGKSILPIKWMPPEAFLDGVFSAKTDVWSFGVLLWEIMTLGYMPYTGLANPDVIHMVLHGGRLGSPQNCPAQVYTIMMQCWHPEPSERPDFATLLERLNYCIQDPDVLGTQIPIIQRPPSSEKDITVMRPPDSDEGFCIQMQHASDYLIPRLVEPDVTSSPSASSVDKLLANAAVWESSNCILPVSQSTQPLLESNNVKDAEKNVPDGNNVNSENVSSTALTKNNNNNNNIRENNTAALPLDPSNLDKQTVTYRALEVSPPSCNSTPKFEIHPKVQDGRPFIIDSMVSPMPETEISC